MRTLRRLLIMLVVAYALACAVLYFAQAHFIFFPEREVQVTPQTFGCAFEELKFPAADSSQLDVWWLNQTATPGLPALLYMHGNAGNIGANAEHACRLSKFGFPVLIFDYRGYGHSEGQFPNEQRAYEDADTAFSLLKSKYGYTNERILLYGHSLGGAVAIELAHRHPVVAGLIVESSFTSIVEMSTRAPQYRIFPIGLLVNQRLESIKKVPELKMPKLFIHGATDEIVPFKFGEKLYAAAAQPKRFLKVPGAGHENSAAVGGELYKNAVMEFVATLQK